MLDVLRELMGDDLRRVHVAAGGRLFRQGSATRGLFLLEAGKVRLLRHTPDGNEVILHTARPCESLAEASLFADHYHCDAVALVDTVAVLAPKARLRALLQTHPQAAELLFATLARRVRELRAQLELRNIRAAEERVLAALRLRAREADGTVVLTGTWKDFSAELGLTHETLYRALAKLERAGKLWRKGTRAWLIGPD